MDHDRARPRANVLHVALERLLRQEVHKARGYHGVTVLMDMSTFYDTIPVLAPALIPWKQKRENVHLSSWVDDVGFDTAGSTPMQVAQTAVEAYRDLHNKLVGLGLRVNPKKTAFIATDKATDRALRELLTPHEPPVASVARDLGVDHQAARRRRIPVLRQRFAKAKQRRLKLLRTLKIPSLRVRLRLHKGGIQPVALRGIEGQGLAARYRTALRQAMAANLGHHTGGMLDATYDAHSHKYIDPADQIVVHHIKALRTLYHTWPTEQVAHLEQAWHQLHQQVQAKQHPWYIVKTPMAATIVYMTEWKWCVEDLHMDTDSYATASGKRALHTRSMVEA